MKRVFSLILLLSSSLSTFANPIIGMPTGSSGGTYFPMGSDIASLAAKEGVEINVKNSSGSLDNIRRMAGSENAGISIVQSDVIDYLSKNPSRINKTVLRNLRLIFPLYNEEVHLLARKEITSISDLQNKRVVVGKLGSGTHITSNNILNIVDVNVEQIHDLTPKEAYESLILGKVDAVFFVGGKPVSYINGLLEMRSDEKLRKYADNVHLVPIDDERLNQSYAKASFLPQDYVTKDRRHQLTQVTVPTVAVKAIMVSHDFSKKTSYYYKMRCKQIDQINTVVRENLALLASGGFGDNTYHPKWSQVDLDQPVELAKSSCITNASDVDELEQINCFLQTGARCSQ